MQIGKWLDLGVEPRCVLLGDKLKETQGKLVVFIKV